VEEKIRGHRSGHACHCGRAVAKVIIGTGIIASRRPSILPFVLLIDFMPLSRIRWELVLTGETPTYLSSICMHLPPLARTCPYMKEDREIAGVAGDWAPAFIFGQAPSSAENVIPYRL
jgi:hypothetical protein